MQSIDRRTLLVAGVAGTAATLALGLATVPGIANPGAQARIGAPAPGFTLADSTGKSVSLADFKGKTVVLEWTNHECPYVRKHYGGQNMQALQKKWTGQGVVWLTVISSMPGSQGYVTAEQANKLTADRGAAPTAVLFDPKGDAGRVYGAQTTPHMYVITGAGTLAYMGGIDDKATTRLDDLKTAKNFVDQALGELAQGKPVSTTTSRPYGCTIKYSS
jgi:peroxiredoxin